MEEVGSSNLPQPIFSRGLSGELSLSGSRRESTGKRDDADVSVTSLTGPGRKKHYEWP